MAFVLRAFGNPAVEEFFLRRGQVFVRVGWRHHFVFVGGKDAPHNFACFGFAGDDGRDAGLRFLDRFVSNVQAQSRFARAFIRPVTEETSVGQKRTDVSITADGG